MRTKQIMRLSTNLIENFFNRDILLTFLTTPYFFFQYWHVICGKFFSFFSSWQKRSFELILVELTGYNKIRKWVIELKENRKFSTLSWNFAKKHK